MIKLFEGFSIISVDEILETCLEVLKSLTLVQEDGETIKLLPGDIIRLKAFKFGYHSPQSI